jgi:hypothetical protein
VVRHGHVGVDLDGTTCGFCLVAGNLWTVTVYWQKGVVGAREGVLTKGELSMYYDELLVSSRGCMQWSNG